MKHIACMVIAALILAGCSSNSEGATSVGSLGELKAYEVEIPRGGTVTCVVYHNANQGGVSCDWSSQ